MVSGVRYFPLPTTPLKRAHSLFLWGNENRLVDVLLTRLFSASHPDWNCFFVQGCSGTGKSLLLHNLQQAWELSFEGGAKLITAVDFAHSFNDAKKNNQTTNWRSQLRQTKLWLMDDVETLVRFPQAQRELCLLLDDFEDGGTASVLTSAVRLSSSQLEATLISRLVGQNAIRLELPELEAREEFITRLTNRHRYSIDQAGIGWLARNVRGSFLEIQTQISARLSEQTGPLSKTAVVQLFRPSDCSPQQQVHQIGQVVAGLYDVTMANLKGPSRRQGIVRARNIVCHVARKHYRLSFYEIAKCLGNRDHSTIIHACKQMSKKLKEESELVESIEEVTSILKRRYDRTPMFDLNR